MIRLFILPILILLNALAVAQNDSLHKDQFNSILEKNQSARQIYETGYNFYLKGEYSIALSNLDRAVELKPFFPEAYFARASVKEALNDKLGALVDYETVIRQEENNQEALFKIAHIHSQLGNYDDCIEQIDVLLSLPEGVTNAVFYKMDQANGGVKEVMTLQSQKADFYNLRAQCYLEKKEFETAIRDFDQAIVYNANDPDLFVNLGLAYKSWGKPTLAEENFKQALKLDPWHKAAIFNLSLKDDRASNQVMIESYTAALQRNQYLAEAYVNRGVIWFAEKAYKKALADFDSAYHLLPKDADVLLNRGLTHEKLGNYRLALQDFQKAFTLGADAALVYGYQANALFHLRDYEKAEAYYTLAINLTNEAKLFFNRGLCRYNLKKYSGACQDFKIASANGIKIARQAMHKYCSGDL